MDVLNFFNNCHFDCIFNVAVLHCFLDSVRYTCILIPLQAVYDIIGIALCDRIGKGISDGLRSCRMQ